MWRAVNIFMRYSVCNLSSVHSTWYSKCNYRFCPQPPTVLGGVEELHDNTVSI
jgi:hypothetical protein